MNHNDNEGYRLLLILIFAVIAFLTFIGLRFFMSLAELEYTEDEEEVKWEEIVKTEEEKTEEGSTEETEATTEEGTDQTTEQEKDDTSEDSHRLEYWRALLSPEKHQIYDTMYQGLKDGQTSVEIVDMGHDATVEIFNAVLCDHPELFWLKGGYTSEGNATKMTFTPNMTVNAADLPGLKGKFDSTVAAILSGVDETWDDYQKIVYFHDYLVDHCIYNLDAAADNEKASAQNVEAPNYVFITANAYGCIVDQSAICQGYAEAMQAICHKANLPCIVVNGTGNGGSHSWNIVYVDGVPYQMDVTWDDPTGKDQKETNANQQLLHDYCLITDEEMYKDHVAETQNIPKCDQTTNNYFVREKMVLDSYSFEAINQMMNEQYKKDQKKFTVKFTHPEEVNKVKTNMMDNGKVYDLDVIKENDYKPQYSIDEKKGILIVYY